MRHMVACFQALRVEDLWMDSGWWSEDVRFFVEGWGSTIQNCGVDYFLARVGSRMNPYSHLRASSRKNAYQYSGDC